MTQEKPTIGLGRGCRRVEASHWDESFEGLEGLSLKFKCLRFRTTVFFG